MPFGTNQSEWMCSKESKTPDLIYPENGPPRCYCSLCAGLPAKRDHWSSRLGQIFVSVVEAIGHVQADRNKLEVERHDTSNNNR